MTTEKNVELKISIFHMKNFKKKLTNQFKTKFRYIKTQTKSFIVTKGEDFLTIIVNKLNYFPV